MELRGRGSCSDDKGVETGVSRRGVSGGWERVKKYFPCVFNYLSSSFSQYLNQLLNDYINWN